MTRIGLIGALAALAFLLPAEQAHAYVGPGLGAGTLAIVLGVVGSVFVALFAVFWYPIKRMLKKRSSGGADPQSGG